MFSKLESSSKKKNNEKIALASGQKGRQPPPRRVGGDGRHLAIHVGMQRLGMEAWLLAGKSRGKM